MPGTGIAAYRPRASVVIPTSVGISKELKYIVSEIKEGLQGV